MAIWNILWRLGIFNDHLVHFEFIWYIFPFLVSCTKKNLATLFQNKRTFGIQLVDTICFGWGDSSSSFLDRLRSHVAAGASEWLGL
jgi:hypothetical protein